MSDSITLLAAAVFYAAACFISYKESKLSNTAIINITVKEKSSIIFAFDTFLKYSYLNFRRLCVIFNLCVIHNEVLIWNFVY